MERLKQEVETLRHQASASASELADMQHEKTELTIQLDQLRSREKELASVDFKLQAASDSVKQAETAKRFALSEAELYVCFLYASCKSLSFLERAIG